MLVAWRPWRPNGARMRPGRRGRPRPRRHVQLAQDGGDVMADRPVRQREPAAISASDRPSTREPRTSSSRAVSPAALLRAAPRGPRGTGSPRAASPGGRPARWPVLRAAAGRRPPRRRPPGRRSASASAAQNGRPIAVQASLASRARPSRIRANGSGRSNGARRPRRPAAATRPAPRGSTAPSSRRTPPRRRR